MVQDQIESVKSTLRAILSDLSRRWQKIAFEIAVGVTVVIFEISNSEVQVTFRHALNKLLKHQAVRPQSLSQGKTDKCKGKLSSKKNELAKERSTRAARVQLSNSIVEYCRERPLSNMWR